MPNDGVLLKTRVCFRSLLSNAGAKASLNIFGGKAINIQKIYQKVHITLNIFMSF